MARRRPTYDPSDRSIPFSRSALDEFLKCQRCFYLHRRLGIGAPSGPMSGLPSVVDALLKKEFDSHRASQTPHPVMADLAGDLVPFAHPDLDAWRKRSPGIRRLHPASGFEVFGAVDDVWLGRADHALRIVDYKTTSSASGPSTDISPQYRRQVEIYQWLLSGNGFDVSSTAFFLFENADRAAEAFEGLLRFTCMVVPYEGDTAWIENALIGARICLDDDEPPAPAPACKVCAYVSLASAQ